MHFKLNRLPVRADMVIAKTEGVLALAGSYGIPIMVLLIAGNVIGRLFGVSFIFSNEISVYMMLPVVFLVAADTLRRGEHIKAEVLTRRLNPQARKVLHIVVELVAFVITVIILISCWQLAIGSYVHKELSNTLLGTPLYLPQMLLALGLSLFTLESAIRVVYSIFPEKK